MDLYNIRTLYRRVYLQLLQVLRGWVQIIFGGRTKSISEASKSLVRGRDFYWEISLPGDIPRLCVLVLERSCSSSLKHPSSSLLDSGSPSPKPLSLSLLEDSLLLVARAVASTALPSWGWVRVASTCLRPTSAAVDRVIPPNEGRDDVCRLKQVTRNECCSIGLIVKSSIFPK
jgi:hypothetical protein